MTVTLSTEETILIVNALLMQAQQFALLPATAEPYRALYERLMDAANLEGEVNG